VQWKVQAGYLYTRKHEWMKREGDTVSAGLTDYAQDMLKDIVYVELPEVGRKLTAGEGFAVIESVKAVSDCYAPVDGVVVAVNEALLDQPELLNQDPYGEGWIVKIEVEAGYENPEMMTYEEYTALLQEESA
jgi:glycine cleavage system H protein